MVPRNILFVGLYIFPKSRQKIMSTIREKEAISILINEGYRLYINTCKSL